MGEGTNGPPPPVSREARIQAARVMIAQGWSPPVPPEEVADRLLDDITNVHHAATNTLAAHELRVLRLSAEGYTEKEIAGMIGITYETVRKHSKRARRKLGARSIAHAVAICFRKGYFQI